MRFPCRKSAHLAGGDRHVLRHRKVRPEIEKLEHHAHFGPLRRELTIAHRPPELDADPLAIQVDFAGIRLFEEVQAEQAGGFSRPRRADQRDLLAGGHLEIHSLQNLDQSVILAQARDAQQRVHAVPHFCH